jgi:uncharacterized protein (DUF427 family)
VTKERKSSDLTTEIRYAREKWQFTGKTRPDFAIEPRKGQESVWDYPRPPRLAPDTRAVHVIVEGVLIADTRNAVRVLETASPPVFYIPPKHVYWDYLEQSATTAVCEWKGRAAYWSVRVGDTFIEDAAWAYPTPFPGFEAIARYVSFYPAKVECRVAGLVVRPQPGNVYGGWITPEIVGPFKGAPGTEWW